MTQLVKCLNRNWLLALCFWLLAIPCFAQTTKEDLILRQQVESLKQELSNQKKLTTTLLERSNQLINNQEKITNQFNIFTKEVSNTLSSGSTSKFKDLFILDKDSRPFAAIDSKGNIYGFRNGNLLGKINSKNEVIRNFDGSIIALIENNFLIDATGHPIGSIEENETLKWEREKNYLLTQKSPSSHFFVKLHSQPFNITNFRSSEWSKTHIKEILYFNEKDVQKLQ